MDKNSQIIDGKVINVVFSNQENGFSVVKAEVNGKIINVVGNCRTFINGNSFRAIGNFEQSKFGQQFKFESVTFQDDITEEGLTDSLCGLVYGFGPVRAKRLINEIGGVKETIKFLDSKVENNFTSIEDDLLVKLLSGWKSTRIARELDAQLSSLELSESIKSKLIIKYGSNALDMVKNYPYRLIRDIEGIGFIKADDIAIKTGISLESDDRLDAACFYAFQKLSDEGDTVSSVNEIEKFLCKLFIERKCSTNFSSNTKKSTLESIERLIEYKDIVKIEDGKYSLTELFDYEENIKIQIDRILNSNKSKIDRSKVSESISYAEENLGIKLSSDQIESVYSVAEKGFIVITGGPGVGKTSNCKAIVALAESSNLSVMLCAPTARAAKRLKESTGCEAYTIHRLLNYQNGKFNCDSSNPINADFLICDESSMDDSMLMSHLLSAVSNKCRLVLVGDVNQLPPVGPGSPFKDIINSEKVPVTRLTTIHRQSEKSDIVKNSHNILNGKKITKSTNGSREDGCFHFVESHLDSDASKILVDVVSNVKEEFDCEPFDTLVISPMRNGICGVNNINKLLQEKINPKDENKNEFIYNRGEQLFRVGDKVRQTKNEYSRGIVNGDIGKIVKISNQDNKNCTIEVDFGLDIGIVSYNRNQLLNLTLSYCGTIHSAQGSEAPVVVISVSNSHYVMLSRTLIYTAITRAKKACIVVGSKKALNIACSNVKDFSRKTALSVLFNKGIK